MARIRAYRRPYAAHRRAYFPRLWPMVLVAVLPTLAFGTSLPNQALMRLAGLLFGIFWSTVVVQVRLWLWRRAHPIVSVRQHLDDLRSKAQWN